MAETVIFEKQQLTGFRSVSTFGGLYYRGFNFGTDMEAITITIGETYKIIWDNTEYEVVAKDGSAVSTGAIYLGNATAFGLEGNNEPFLILWSTTGIGFLSITETIDTHTVGIYQLIRGKGIVLKSWDEGEKVFGNVNSIEVLLEDGSTQKYIPMQEGGLSVDEPCISYKQNEDGNFTEAIMYGFLTIPSSCFYNQYKLETVDLSHSPNVNAIGGNAFYGCKALTSFAIPSGITSMGNYAFYQCTGLKSIIIPGCDVGNYAFQKCTGLESVVIQEGTVNIGTKNGDYSFAGCTALKRVTIPSTVKRIGWASFYQCPLESVTFAEPNGWYWTKTEGATSGTSVDMSDPTAAAEALKNNYNCYWYRQ